MSDSDNKLIKRKQNIDLIKFILGTVILGLTAHFINLKIQSSQIELEVKKAEVEYLDKFIPRYVDAPLKKKLDFVDFMRHASHSEETRNIYNTFYKKIAKNIDSLIRAESKSNILIDSLIDQNLLMKNRIKNINTDLNKSGDKQVKLHSELSLTYLELEKNKRLLMDERKKNQKISKEIGNSSVKVTKKTNYLVRINEKLELPDFTLTPHDYIDDKLKTYCSYIEYDDTETLDLIKDIPEKLFSNTGIYIITFIKFTEESETATILVETYQ